MPRQSDSRLDILGVRPISSWDFPRILVGIPIERSISYASQVFFPFLNIAMQGPDFAALPYGRTDFVRNQYAIQLLQSTYSHLLMLDVDHVHPVDIIQRFAVHVILDPSLKVICGMNFRRGKPFDPVVRILADKDVPMMIDEWEPGLCPVDEVGTGSILIHRSVFEELEPPWFFNTYDKVWQNLWPGEDIGFSQKCRDHHIDMYVDTTISSPHCAETLITEGTYRRYQELHKNDEEALNV